MCSCILLSNDVTRLKLSLRSISFFVVSSYSPNSCDPGNNVVESKFVSHLCENLKIGSLSNVLTFASIALAYVALGKLNGGSCETFAFMNNFEASSMLSVPVNSVIALMSTLLNIPSPLFSEAKSNVEHRIRGFPSTDPFIESQFRLY